MASYVNDFCETVQLYYNDLKKLNPIDRETEKDLITKAKNGDIKARDKILTANLKFVFDVAKKYRGCGVSMPDLIGEGNLGLTKAIERFDEDKDVKFISYAVWWIKQAILDFIKKTNNLKSHEMLEEEIVGGKPNGDEKNEKEEAQEQIEPSELDEPPTSEDTVKKLLATLSERERLIVKMYYGVGSDKEFNLEEIGSVMELSKERVRQIKKKALRKMRTEVLINNDYGFDFI